MNLPKHRRESKKSVAAVSKTSVSRQWGPQRVGFFNAWQQLEALDVTPSEAMLMTGDCPRSPQRSSVGCQVVVALIDTGFNFQHEDIQGHRSFWGS